MISAPVARLRLFLLAVVAALALGASPAWAAGPLRISQVYGGGGNSGATYTHDFIELFNSGTTLIDLTFMSVQYGSTTGNIGPNSAQITDLSGFVAPGQYVLIQEAQGAGGTTPLSPDITDPTPIFMSATGGKVALVSNNSGLNCGAAATPCGPSHFAQIVDLVGYDGANMFEGAGAAPTLSNTTAALRGNNGCTDTDNNAADFAAGAPNPRNRLSSTFDCQGDVAPQVAATTPANAATNVATDANVSVTFTEAVNVAGSWFTISCGSSGSHTATVSGGPMSFTLNPDTVFANSETCTVTIVASQVTDQDANDPPDNMTADHVFSFATEAPPPPPVRIHDIQGSSHTAAMLGPVSGVVGVVTAKRSNGYYMQDPSPDASDATSEGIFVFTSSSPSSVNVGDSVRVSGTVVEFRPGGSSSANLTITEITSPSTTVLSSGNPLPAPMVLGMGGRVSPGTVIEDDAAGSVETSGVFDPATDGIDLYESMEHMRLQVNDAVAAGPENRFGEIFVLTDDGAGAAVRTSRGGIVIRDLNTDAPGDYRSGDFNPERIQLDDALLAGSTPAANVGDHFTTAAVGILDYDFGNFELNLTAALTTVSDGVARESTDPQGPKQIAIATYNVENLDANEPQSKFDTLASQIVNNLRSPDVVALEEIQDNNGATNDSVVDANLTLDKLVTSIQAAGGPTYSWRQINPVDDQDGGEPGGNIRVAFLFRTDRGAEFIDRPGGDSVTPTTVVAHPSGPQLSFSPGRVSPTHTAWNASRKPLAAEFKIRNRTFFMIANHFNSKGGDQPLFGRFQPPTRGTEVQRHQQAQLVNDFVDSILAVDPNANVVVIGDINDFQFSQTVDILKGGVLNDLVDALPVTEQYSYVFEGNSQVLDHILVTNSLFGLPFVFDPVHANAEFADQASDHDPNIVRFTVNSPPRAGAGGPYAANEGGTTGVSATGTDDEGDALTYAWDLDNNGSFETAGQSATFSAAALDGPATRTVRVQVSDGAAADVAEATVNIANVAPAATLAAPASTFAGFPFALSLNGASDPSAADTAAGFTYAFDCGDGSGYGAFGPSASASCATTTTGSRSVGAKIRDKDGGVTEYNATVAVVVTFDSLCDLVQAYSTDAKVAEELCDKLANAEAAPTAGARAGHLGAFRNQVDAKTGDQPGKAFTAEEGALLKLLSTEL